MFTVGNADRYIDRYIGRRTSNEYRSYVDGISANCRLYVGQLSVAYRSTVGRISVNCRSHIGQLSVAYRSTVGRISVVC